MFELYVFLDEVILQPGELSNFNLTLENKIKNKLVNKVIPNEGLCVALKSIKVLDKIVVQGEGTVQTKVELSAVLIRPQVDEVLNGKVTTQNEYGIAVDIANLSIFIPSENLMKPSYFDSVEKKWLWRFKDYDLYYENNQSIKFRVKEINFSKEYQQRIKSQQLYALGQLSALEQQSDAPALAELDQNFIPSHYVVGQCEEECLGMNSWW
ncbi:dna-directed rna polymerase iii subunit rpc8 isoform x1 [Stylonychia lemnae]|uniref:Dna-directed rna polymerase iii subunit rpc8 isoform x1 n=1 Tax=Stylonychia lemnae TaxID=5949 RepID=A0A078A9M8_STYLE|nr:dna-directed rna polymerase iii subunit rpc8 isoform x1 [Stylonychia lemnae]|eukprot:CDW77503.1 dna-directed rna polymerase iii subunit rpc8 isoform x1 [Stylonychia lemnae]